MLVTGFSLVVGPTLPPDDDLYTVAKLSAWSQGDGALVQSPKLALLAVDSVAVQACDPSTFTPAGATNPPPQSTAAGRVQDEGIHALV